MGYSDSFRRIKRDPGPPTFDHGIRIMHRPNRPPTVLARAWSFLLGATLLLLPGALLAQAPASPGPVHAPAPPGPTAAQIASIDSIFAEWDDPRAPGAAVAVTRDGRLIYSQGYGSAQLEHLIPVTSVTVFHVASVSKQFTTFAIALLARDGLLSWDDEVGDHIEEFPDFDRSITLRHLATHTSGVRDQWELLRMAGWRLDDVITRDQILRLMARQQELNFEPGSAYLYSNMGYSLLAEVVERVSGQDFDEFLQERVFRPLGMHRTHVHSDHQMVVPGRAYSYAPAGEGHWRKAVLSYANQGATSLFTTVEDLARWIGEFEEPLVGDPELWAEMRERAALTTGDTADYALGLQIASYRGLRTIGHGGADAGFRTNLMHFPDERIGVVVFGNASNFNAAGSARAVAEVFLDAQMEPRVVATGEGGGGQGGNDVADPPNPSLAQLAEYEGTYYSVELDSWYRVRLVDGELQLEHPRHPDATLRYIEDDRLQGGTLRTLEFSRDSAGAIDGFRAGGGRVLNLRFERIADPAG